MLSFARVAVVMLSVAVILNVEVLTIVMLSIMAKNCALKVNSNSISK